MDEELDLLEESEEIAFGDLPTKTYAVKNGRIISKIDELEAMKQLVEKTLLTERFEYVIYTSYFGTELMSLFGLPIDLAEADVERRIEEALTIDERIVAIEDFTIIKFEEGILYVRFTVITIFGDFYEERGITVAD